MPLRLSGDDLMHPLLRALLSAWDLRLDVVLVLGLATTCYVLGWLRLRKQNPATKIARRRHLASYLSGIGLIALSLLSPIDALAGQLFFMHMLQHMLMISFAAPLLWLGNPFPVAMWGLPKPLRKLVSRVLAGKTVTRMALVGVTGPAICWFIFITVYIGWHDPDLYNLALTHGWVHDIQHLTFFGAAMIYWWPVLDGAPYLRKAMPAWARLAYLLAVIPPTMATGIVIATSDTLIYSYYASVPRIWGIDPLTDQAYAGAIMWIPGNEMQVQTAVLLLYRWLRQEEKGVRNAEYGGQNGGREAPEHMA